MVELTHAKKRRRIAEGDLLAPTLYTSGEFVNEPRVNAKHARRPFRLGTILLERQLIIEDQLVAAVARQKQTGRRLGETLIEMRFASADAILSALGTQLNVATLRLDGAVLHEGAISSLPAAVAPAETRPARRE